MAYQYLLTNSERLNITAKNYDKKYQKLLNNLLQIKSKGDNTLFFKVTTLNHDVYKMVSDRDFQTIYHEPEFKVKLQKININTVAKKIEACQTVDELLDLISVEKLRITATLRKQFKDLGEAKLSFLKRETLKKFEDKNLTFSTKWIKNIKEINDIYNETNIWPCYLGTYFLSVKIGDKSLYSPLVLKEVNIIKEDNEFYFVSKDDSVMFNEKLIFFLENKLNITFPKINEDMDSIPLDKLTQELDEFFGSVIVDTEAQILQPFEEKTSTEIENKEVIKCGGIVCLVGEPAGGNLRKALLNLINSGEINSIVKVDSQEYFTLDQTAIKNVIETQVPIARICPTDPSQEKAIISALNNNLIIIGPPGTGKSQTIANILANVLLQNKKALFISQKKAALDVVLERLGKLNLFVFSLLDSATSSSWNTSQNDKKEFYDSLKLLLNWIKTNFGIGNSQYTLNPLISEVLNTYWLNKEIYAKFQAEELQLFYSFENKYHDVPAEDLYSVQKQCHALSQANFSKYLETIITTKTQDLDTLANAVGIKKKGFWLWKKYPKEMDNLLSINNEIVTYLKTKPYDYAFYQDVNKIQNVEQFLKINYLSDNLNQPLPEVNHFKNNEEIILKTLLYKFVETFKTISSQDADIFGKFVGAIEAGRALPHKFINKFKDILKQLFNVLVGTPESLANFIDFEHDKYDYVIFDEASQLFLEKGIPYIAIADKSIIAGDNQQMQPSVWFEIREEYDDDNDDKNDESLLNWAIQNGFNKQNLELNYRSVAAELTTFSSKEFYESNLKTVDKNNYRGDAIEVINVNGIWEDSMNRREAELMVDLLIENLKHYNKIILLTLNAAQMGLVNELIFKRDMKLYDYILSGRVIVKNLENIQGDEADLVIVSVGYAANALLSATYVGHKGGRNALNVAITRAREKMIVLKSIQSSEVRIANASNLDLLTFKNWLAFLELNPQERKTYSFKQVDSMLIKEAQFSESLKTWLEQLQFVRTLEIKTNYPIGSYNIDFAIFDKDTQQYLMGVEIDGLKDNLSMQEKYDALVRRNFIKAKGYELLIVSQIMWEQNKPQLQRLILDILHSQEIRTPIKQRPKTNYEKLLQKTVEVEPELDDSDVQIRDAIYPVVSQADESLFDSYFEKDIYKWLLTQKFKRPLALVNQFHVDKYRIDLAFLDAKSQAFLLGIEVDGLRYHSSADQKYNDVSRQQYLESKGMRIFRISEKDWNGSKNELFNNINDLL
ncbi:AAA domain-containing protein [Ureaplasma ceti]|uniref:AAA domain-containing protein n=1 Tax=Ureaplasma ceti TaxID=3119530 RepID=A0ABP9UC61_9BACT